MSFLLLFIYDMIDKLTVENLVNKAIEGTDVFVTEITVSPMLDIVVELDSATGVDLDFCTRVSEVINEALEPGGEDYSLEVGTASLSAPFKVDAQFDKHLGDDVDVVTADGRKLTGTLTAFDPSERKFTVEVAQKVKEPGKKKPVIEQVPLTLAVDECRSVAYHFDFK